MSPCKGNAIPCGLRLVLGHLGASEPVVIAMKEHLSSIAKLIFHSQEAGIAANCRGIDRQGPLSSELHQVMWTTGLGPGTRQPTTAERLHTDHRADHVSINIDVARSRRICETASA